MSRPKVVWRSILSFFNILITKSFFLMITSPSSLHNIILLETASKSVKLQSIIIPPGLLPICLCIFLNWLSIVLFPQPTAVLRFQSLPSQIKSGNFVFFWSLSVTRYTIPSNFLRSHPAYSSSFMWSFLP